VNTLLLADGGCNGPARKRGIDDDNGNRLPSQEPVARPRLQEALRAATEPQDLQSAHGGGLSVPDQAVYRIWARRHPRALDVAQVTMFLNRLAVERQVVTATQNRVGAA